MSQKLYKIIVHRIRKILIKVNIDMVRTFGTFSDAKLMLSLRKVLI